MLKRTLGLWDVFSLAAGVMISSGLFVLPGIAFGLAGPAVIFAYAVAGLMAVPAMFSQAELATAMPKSGGTYFFIERSLGTLPGVLAGAASWMGVTLKSTFALIGIGAFARLFWPEMEEYWLRTIAIVLCLVFSALNILSVHGVKKFQAATVMVVIVVLAGFIIAGIATQAEQADRYAPFTPFGWPAAFATAGVVFISYGGLTKIASVAEEVRDPAKNIPWGMGIAILVVSLLYVGVVFVVVGVTDPEVLKHTLTPLSEAGKDPHFGGTFARVVLTLTAVLALVTAANGGILAASRDPMAMARDGLLPSFLQYISPRFGTPVAGVGVTALFMIIVMALLDVSSLVKTGSLMMLLLFTMVNIAVLVMRFSKVQNYRPSFRSPWFPWMQIAGIACYSAVTVTLVTQLFRGHHGHDPNPLPVIMTACVALLGGLWYVVYIRRRVQRESAFVYLVKGIVSREMYRSDLEEELKQIALERDEVVHDHFDHLVLASEVLDIDGAILRDDMLRKAAEMMSPRVGMTQDALFEKFLARERESSTVIQAGLAIPHVLIEGEDIFEMLMVRAKAGIMFPQHSAPVKAAFVLVGTADQRNEHLRALMAIAHTVQEQDFYRRWMDAGDAEHLRDIMLLSDRKRVQHAAS